MINNITSVDTHMQKMSVAKAVPSQTSLTTPAILGFKTPVGKKKAELRVKKFKRSDKIVIVGEIEDDYIETVEEDDYSHLEQSDMSFSFINLMPKKKKVRYLKDCYIIDYIQSPQAYNGLGTEAVKGLAEKAMFDPKIQGRIVTYTAPVWQESSPAIFFYKLGFRFLEPEANQRIQKCIETKTPDLPAQTGMMYLPKANLHKLLRYGELF